MKAQRIVVHAGLPKTGSSSIQLDLYLNRSEMLEQGVLYPEAGMFGPGHHLLAHCGYPQDAMDFSPELFQYQYRNSEDSYEQIATDETERTEQFRHLIANLIEEIEQTPCHTVIVSSEALSNWGSASIELFCDALKQLPVAVDLLFYLRRQDLLLESLIRQNERALHRHFHEPEQIEQLITHNAFDFNQTLKPWINQLSRQHVILKSFEDLRQQGSLISDFRRLAGIKDETNLARFDDANTSLSRDCVEYLIEKSSTMDKEELESLGHLLEDYSETNPDRPQWRHYLSPQQRQSVIERFRSSNFMLAIDMSANIKKLIPEAPIDPDEDWSPYPGLSDRARSGINEYLDQRSQAEQELNSLPD